MPISITRVNQVLIIPDLGATNEAGFFDVGRALGNFNEIDLVDFVVNPLVNCLTERRIANVTLETRNWPGHRQSTRHHEIGPSTLVLDIRMGTMGRKSKSNISQVSYGSKPTLPLADMMVDALADWGLCSIFGHRVANPRLLEHDPILAMPDCHGIRIEPFAMDGPNAETYLGRLPRLGYELGLLISEYLAGRGEAQASRPLRM